jgi:hypothetical protein
MAVRSKIWMAAMMTIAVLGLIQTALAQGGGPWEIGPLGDAGAVTAVLEDGTLSISGSGEMRNWIMITAPWRADEYRNLIETVVIGDGVTSIGANAFNNCTRLTSVTIGNSVTTIEGQAFRGTALTSVVIPNSVTTIGSNAFNSAALTTVAIGNSVTTIGGGAFNSNSGLISVIIPNSVTTIGDSAFASTGLTSIIIPNNVTTIGAGAFLGCGNLTSVTIGNSVTSIGNGAFYATGGLTSVTIPNSVEHIGGSAFALTGLTSVTIPDNVTSIGASAFANSQLRFAVIGSGVTAIGMGAFANNNNLVRVDFLRREGVMTSMGTGIFASASPQIFGFIENTSVSGNAQFADRFTPYELDISLSQTDPHVFAPAPFDYGAQTPLTVTISANELFVDAATGELTIALIGANPAAFTLNRTTATLGQGDVTSFTVTPAEGLNYGVYNAMVSVSAPLSFFTVSFTVKPEGMGTVSIAGWTHGEAPNAPHAAGGSSLEVTFEYKLADADDDTYSETVPTNAGNYMVRATFAETATHMAHTATYNFTISKADPQYTLPEGLAGRIGDALSSVTLPTAQNGAWLWMNGETIISEPIGEQEFPARFIPTNSANFNIMENIDITVAVCTTTSISVIDRVIPGEKVEETVIIAPVTASSEITVGPNPVARQAGAVNIFRVGRQIRNGTLTVYDASGNFIRRVSINDNASGDLAARVIGSWDLTDNQGRLVSEGTYLVRGTITTLDGKRERVSTLIGVR